MVKGVNNPSIQNDMKTAIVKLKSASPYSQSRFHGTEKEPKETNDAYDLRTWREKSHFDTDGNVFIPPMALKRTLDEAAKRNGRQVPGKGKERYTKHFVSGVMVTERIYLGITKDDLVLRKTLCDSQGKKGASGGSSVIRNFPDIPTWEAVVEFHILNDIITGEVFEEMLTEAGQFVGIGVFRPENGGYYGRFSVEKITWK